VVPHRRNSRTSLRHRAGPQGTPAVEFRQTAISGGLARPDDLGPRASSP
jgi:hypothetical protein